MTKSSIKRPNLESAHRIIQNNREKGNDKKKGRKIQKKREETKKKGRKSKNKKGSTISRV